MAVLDKVDQVGDGMFRLINNSNPPEYSPYLGGCLVTKLPNANAYWITKTEYEEHGVNILKQKLPVSV